MNRRADGRRGLGDRIVSAVDVNEDHLTFSESVRLHQSELLSTGEEREEDRIARKTAKVELVMFMKEPVAFDDVQREPPAELLQGEFVGRLPLRQEIGPPGELPRKVALRLEVHDRPREDQRLVARGNDPIVLR